VKGGIWFGGDYNPEQWDAATWAEDDALMNRARVNTVTVGVFSWALLEPAEGKFEFGWLDDTLDRLHAGGARVVLATPTASPPPWFTLVYPDAMPVRLSIDGKFIATLTANSLGDVTYMISPALLHLAAARHLISLASMLITETAGFTAP
jgi:beta-galactosidase